MPIQTDGIVDLAGTGPVVAPNGITSTGALTLNSLATFNAGIILPAPSSGNTLDVTGKISNFAAWFKGDSTAGGSFGVLINAGTNSGDYGFRVTNQAGSSTQFTVQGDGNVGLGTANPLSSMEIQYTGVASGSTKGLRIDNTNGKPFLLQSGIEDITDTGFSIRDVDAATSRLAIDGVGKILIGTTNSSLYGHSARVTIASADPAFTGLYVSGSSATYAGDVVRVGSERGATAAYDMFTAISDIDSGADVEFRLAGDGVGYSDGGWTTPAADYAEFFESTDGSVLEHGRSVVLDTGKVRYYDSNTDSLDDIIGVIRPKNAAAIVGNSAWNKWEGKYLTTDFGGYQLDVDGYRILNPNYDPEMEYIPRRERDEWNLIGLLGQVPVKKLEPVNPRWVLMGDYNLVADTYMVR